MEENKPLNGMNCLVMRQPQQAKTLMDGIERLGGTAFLVPLLSFRKKSLSDREKGILHELTQFDWLIFTSQNGVKYFLHYMEELRFTIPDRLKIAAVGTKTAELLQNAGFSTSFLPEKFTGEVMGKEMVPLLHPTDKVCIIKGNLARDMVGQALKQASIFKEEVVIYETFLPDENEGKLIEYVQNGMIDLFIFTSPSNVEHFFSIINKMDGFHLIEQKTIACIGPVTKQALNQYGLQTDICPETFTAEGLLKEIELFYSFYEK